MQRLAYKHLLLGIITEDNKTAVVNEHFQVWILPFSPHLIQISSYCAMSTVLRITT